MRMMSSGRAWNPEPCTADPSEIQRLLVEVRRHNLGDEFSDDQVGYIRVDEASALGLFKSEWTPTGVKVVEMAIQTAKEKYGELDFDLSGDDWTHPDMISPGFNQDSLVAMVAPSRDRRQRERMGKNYDEIVWLFHFSWDEIDTPHQSHYDHSPYPSKYLSLEADPEPDFGV